MKTIKYKELDYKVDYIGDDIKIDFEVYEINENDHSIMRGYIKWDGCINFVQNSHYCSLENAKSIYLLFKEIYAYKNKYFNESDSNR